MVTGEEGLATGKTQGRECAWGAQCMERMPVSRGRVRTRGGQPCRASEPRKGFGFYSGEPREGFASHTT